MRPYTLRRSRRSANISLRVDNDGVVLVTAPPLVPKFMVEVFLRQQEPWIMTQLQKQQKKVAVERESDILLFGKRYHKKIISSASQRTGFTILEQALVYNNSLQLITTTTAQYNKAVARFLKQTAELYLLPKSYTLARTMGVQFSHITLREQRTRWGSCSSRGTINFNWRLVHFSPPIIDYVIIH